MDVTIRSQDVYRQNDDQQAGRADVCGLEVPVSRPKAPAHGCPGRQRKKKQREQSEDPGVFIARRGRLDVLDRAVVDGEQYANVEKRGGERQPAEKLVTAQLESAGGAGARPDCQHAQDETSGNRAQAQSLRDLPRHSG